MAAHWPGLLAFRSLVRAKGYALSVVLTLGLGIGAAASVFAFVEVQLIKPLPYPNPDRLFDAWISLPGMHFDRAPQSVATYFAFRRFAQSIDAIAVFDRTSVNLADSSGQLAPERIRASLVTATLLPMLGARFQIGRGFTDSEDAPRSDPAVIISDGLWRRRFGADRSVLGARLHIDGLTRRVVGVLDPAFHFPDADTELWIPIALDPNAAFAGPFAHQGIVRLRAGVDQSTAERELNALLPRAAELFPSAAPSFATSAVLKQSQARAFLRPLRDDVIGSFRNVLQLAAGAAALLLLIACANASSLFVARSDARRRETGIRLALGAHRRHIAARHFAEVMLLAAAGGTLGFVLADIGLAALRRASQTGIPRLNEASIDSSVVAFVVSTSLLVSALCGLAPALQFRGDELSTLLRDGARGGTTGRERQRLRRALAIAQVAFAVVLVTCTSMLLRTVERLQAVRPGFDDAHALSFWVSLPKATYPTDSSAVRVTELLLSQLAVAPGVQGVGASSKLPLNSVGSSFTPIWTDNDQTPSGVLPRSRQLTTATTGYFAAMRIPLLAGRTFDHPDRQAAYEVIVDERLATEYWRDSTGQRAIGRTLRLAPTGAPTYTIVGVVGAVRDTSLAGPPTGIVYFPDVVAPDSNQSSVARTIGVVLRGDADVASLSRAAQRTLRSVDPDLPPFNMVPMSAVVKQSMARVSFTSTVIGVAAVTALALAAVGLNGLLAYMVRLDTREIGVRMAIGASPFEIAGRVARRGARLTILGIAAGLVLFAGAARLVTAAVAGVEVADPIAVTGMVACLLAVALCASWLPARRAASVDPSRALASE